MEKSQKKIVAIFCSVVLALAILAGVLWMLQPKEEERMTYVLTPQMVSAFFGVELEDFFNAPVDWNGACEDFRNHASIDQDGNLVLRLTFDQILKDMEVVYSDLEGLDELEEVEISEDYTSITITGNRDEVLYVYGHELGIWTIVDMAKHQLYGGRDPGTISVTFTIVDKNSGQTVYTGTWPDEDIVLDPKTWNFSE